MTIAGRNTCIVILLGLLIGHASVAMHTAAHAMADVADCGICVSYGDLSKAIVDSQARHSIPTSKPVIATPVLTQAPQPRRAIVRQRSPPAST